MNTYVKAACIVLGVTIGFTLGQNIKVQVSSSAPSISWIFLAIAFGIGFFVGYPFLAQRHLRIRGKGVEWEHFDIERELEQIKSMWTTSVYGFFDNQIKDDPEKAKTELRAWVSWVTNNRSQNGAVAAYYTADNFSGHATLLQVVEGRVMEVARQ